MRQKTDVSVKAEKFSKDLKELAIEIINYQEKEMILLTDQEIKFMKNKKYVTYAKESFVMIKIRKANMTFIIKSEIIVITQENLEELLIIFAI